VPRNGKVVGGQIDADFNAKVESAFNEMIARTSGGPAAVSA
jgi:hypothetical protein